MEARHVSAVSDLQRGRSALEALGHAERLEEPCARLGLPYIPEYDLRCLRDLYFGELSEAARRLDAAVAAAPSPEALAWRGRARRLLGDAAGAAQDLRAALDGAPELAMAHAWLAELDLRRPEAVVGVSRALELSEEPGWALLYRAAARLMAGAAEPARQDLERYIGLRPDSALGLLLLGLAEEGLRRRKRAARCYEAAAARHPVCSAAALLRSRAASSDADAARWLTKAYNVSPVLGFITLQIDRALAVEAPAYVRRIRRFCFEQPEKVGAYYRREATQSHFSHFPAEDYSFVEKLVGVNDGLAWAHGFFGRAACYAPQGVEEGVRHLSRAIALAPHAGWLYAWRANALRAAGRLEAAEKDFDRSIRLQPFYHRAFVWRGALYRKLGRLDEALADLDRALAMDPHYSLTYYERSMARRGKDDLLGAVLDLDRAFLLDHRYRWVFKTGGPPSPADFSRGLRELDRGVKRHPSCASLRVWRGQLFLERGESSRALEDLLRSVSLDPHHALAFGWLGRALFEAGEAARALDPLKRAVALEPRFWMARGWLAEALFAAGRRGEAEAVLSGVLRDKPTTPWAHLLRARFAGERGQWRKALPALERALLLDGKYPDAYLLLSQARLAVGDVRGAAAAAQRCIEIAPNLGRAYAARAAVAEKAGRAEDVVADYRRILAEFPYLLNAEQRARVERIVGGAVAAA